MTAVGLNEVQGLIFGIFENGRLGGVFSFQYSVFSC
jgi:hypothetical protein